MHHTPITRAAPVSGVLECEACEGKGHYWRHPRETQVSSCIDCDGTGHHACAVCGFDITIPGRDCLPCELVADIPADLLTEDTGAALANAVVRAVAYARAHRERIERAAKAAAMVGEA